MGVVQEKTSLCQYWLKNCCARGDKCTFAHGEHELKNKPDLSKTSWCKTFLKKGSCPAGQKCNFAHSADELRQTTSFQRTKVCTFFPSGQCRHGPACRFLHPGIDQTEIEDDSDKYPDELQTEYTLSVCRPEMRAQLGGVRKHLV